MNVCIAAIEEEYSNEGYKYYEQDILDNNVDDDSSSDTEDTQSFEKIAKKMVDITANGGVKKQTILHGVGEVIPPDANVLSNFIL